MSTGENKFENIRDSIQFLATGLLEGFSVEYRSSKGEVRLTGKIQRPGILCDCIDCGGAKIVSLAKFEIHAGSRKKKASLNTFIKNGKSVKELFEEAKATGTLSVSKDINEQAIVPTRLETLNDQVTVETDFDREAGPSSAEENATSLGIVYPELEFVPTWRWSPEDNYTLKNTMEENATSLGVGYPEMEFDPTWSWSPEDNYNLKKTMYPEVDWDQIY